MNCIFLKPEYTENELKEIEEAATKTQPQASERQRAMKSWWCRSSVPSDAY